MYLLPLHYLTGELVKHNKACSSFKEPSLQHLLPENSVQRVSRRVSRRLKILSGQPLDSFQTASLDSFQILLDTSRQSSGNLCQPDPRHIDSVQKDLSICPEGIEHMSRRILAFVQKELSICLEGFDHLSRRKYDISLEAIYDIKEFIIIINITKDNCFFNILIILIKMIYLCLFIVLIYKKNYHIRSPNKLDTSTTIFPNYKNTFTTTFPPISPVTAYQLLLTTIHALLPFPRYPQSQLTNYY